MQLVDREQFEGQMAQLCSGFNTPLTPERMDAYWRGLERMRLPEFALVVSHALGPDGPERMPTTRACWDIHQRIRRGRASSARTTESKPHQTDALALTVFDKFANRRMLGFLAEHGAATTASLQAMITAKNQLSRDFESMHRDEPVTPEEFANALRTAWRRTFKPAASLAEASL